MNRKLLSQVLLFTAIILSFVYPFPFLENIPYAHATGGAYTSTKHGGGTVDGAPFNGVQRGVNTVDYSTGIYNTVNPEAGQYQSGECAHCHEMHSSFGGTEPPPASGSTADPGGGPNTYLGMADTNPELCWYCHENISSTNPIGYPNSGYYYFYQGKTKYQAAGHNTNANMLSPGYGVGSPWPRTARTGIAGHCLNCHTPHGIKEPSAAPYDTTAVPSAPTNKHLAANNPDVSTDYLIPRQSIAWEEALCENCHKSGGVLGAADVRTDILKLDTVAAGGTGTGSGHPIHNVDQTGSNAGATFSGRHSLKNEATPAQGWNSYSGTIDRHVECVDCHNPHVAQNATVFQQSGTITWNPNRISDAGGVKAGGTNKGVWGITLDTTTGSTVASAKVYDTNSSLVNYSSLYLYQICLKCHSAFADATLTSNASPSYTNRARWPAASLYYWSATAHNLSDVAVDFSMSTTPITGTLLKGYHPVFGAGRNQPLAAPQASNVTNPRWALYQTPNPCPNAGAGWPASNPCPDGTGRWTGKRADSPAADLSNNFVPPWGQSSLVTCVDCHESDVETSARGPHGSSRPFILRKLDTGITYDVYNGAGANVTVQYSAFNHGWTAGNGYAVTNVNIGTYDPNNLCLNCHRADVYGFMGMYSSLPSPCNNGCGGTPTNCFPRYTYLSRQPHPADGVETFAYANGNCDTEGRPPRGIVCLRCHGGGTIGGIHGNSGATGFTYNTTAITPSSNRLLNGTAWSGVRFGSTASTGNCTKNGGATLFNGCADSSSGNFWSNTTYNY